jgi:hypothetical protein
MSTRFQVPGIVTLAADGTTTPVFAFASSPGRWSASLRLATRLNLVPLPRDKFTSQDVHHLLWETGSAPLAIQVGDLLRLTLDRGEQWLFPVSEINPVSEIKDETSKVVLKAETVWQVLGATTVSSPPGPEVFSFTNESLMRVEPSSLSLPPHLNRVERIRFDLSINDADQHRFSIRELAFNAPHSRFWGIAMALESSPFCRRSAFDGTLKQTSQKTNNSNRATIGNADATLATRVAQLYSDLQTDKRIETGGDGSIDPLMLTGLLAPLKEDSQPVYLPLGMLLTDSGWEAPAPGDIGQDDLDNFEPSLFLDGYLVSATQKTLMAIAIDRHYVQDRRLYGLHSLTFIDEVALVSLPDANNRGWRLGEVMKTPAADTSAKQTIASKEMFIDCAAAPTVQAVEPSIGPVVGGTQVTVIGTGFALGTSISFAGNPALEVQVLNLTQLRCKTPVAGNAGSVAVEVVTANGSGLSTNAFTYQWPATPSLLPEMIAVDEFNLDHTLLPVHEALINFCQARSDIVGILTLPAHFEKQQCIEWQERLRVQLGLPRRRTTSTDVRDLADLSYVAVYHPWLLIRDTTVRDGLRPVSPDGVVCGMIAAREHTRNVWVAPANVPMRGALGLTPNFTEDDWADLYASQFNLLREETRDIRLISAHTLSDERSLLQLSVRRLLIQLRKAALEKGMDYVFASNHEQTHNAIRLSLESLLRFMFERSAFAGATQPSAFRIFVDTSINPPQSVEQGRLIAQIQIAPSEPLEFITVVLTRTDEDLLQATEV